MNQIFLVDVFLSLDRNYTEIRNRFFSLTYHSCWVKYGNQKFTIGSNSRTVWHFYWLRQRELVFLCFLTYNFIQTFITYACSQIILMQYKSTCILSAYLSGFGMNYEVIMSLKYVHHIYHRDFTMAARWFQISFMST